MEEEYLKQFNEWFNSLTPEEQKQYVDELHADDYKDDGPISEPSFYLV